MPKTAKKTKAKEGKKKSSNWDDLLETLEKGGANGNVWFCKTGVTRVKLVLPDDDDPNSFWEETTSSYKGGKPRAKYLMSGVVLSPKPEDGEYKVRAVQVAKSAFKQIIGLLAEGYNLFDPEDGHAIKITKTGEGLSTSWAVVPSPDAVETPEAADLEESLADISASLMEDSEESDDEDEGEEKPAKKKASKKSSAKKSKSKKKDEDEEEEEDDEDWE